MIQRKILSVSDLTAKVKKSLAQTYNLLWIGGELSNLSRPASGHLYFSLKDKNSQVRCAMFRSRNRTINVELQNGMQVNVFARPDLYAARGDFQLIVENLEESGEGQIQKRFEALKKKLSAEGLFDPQKKRVPTVFPDVLGIVTSPQGAAVKDVLKTIRHRFAPLNVIIYPTLVQGEAAPEAICRAIQTANHRNETDTILLVRGGGSLEDLQAFNDEQVVRTVAASNIPVISGIGHDIDFTLADFAADLHTPTPTAAAYAACPDASELKQRLFAAHLQMKKIMSQRFKTDAQRLKILQLHLNQRHPLTKIEYLMQRLDNLSDSLHTAAHNNYQQTAMSLLSLHTRLRQTAPLRQISQYAGHIDQAQWQLKTLLQRCLTRHQHLLENQDTRLKSLNPMAVLNRGFAVATTDDRRIIRSPKQAPPGSQIKIQVAKGVIDAVVKAPESK